MCTVDNGEPNSIGYQYVIGYRGTTGPGWTCRSHRKAPRGPPLQPTRRQPHLQVAACGGPEAFGPFGGSGRQESGLGDEEAGFPLLVNSVMRTPVATIAPEATLREAARLMRAQRAGCLVVSEGESAVGILTESDLVRIVAEGGDPDALRVRGVMTSPVVTIEPAAHLEDAGKLMQERRIKRLVVAVGGKLRGVVTVRDIAYSMPEVARRYAKSIEARWEG